MYSDKTLLITGKYKFVSLGRVPAQWLLDIYKKGTHADYELFEYIVANLDKIKARNTGSSAVEPIKLTCDKFMYATESIARAHLRGIKNTEQEHKKPNRAYECRKCGGWHLTSMDYNKEKPI